MVFIFLNVRSSFRKFRRVTIERDIIEIEDYLHAIKVCPVMVDNIVFKIIIYVSFYRFVSKAGTPPRQLKTSQLLAACRLKYFNPSVGAMN